MRFIMLKSFLVPGWGLWSLGRKNEGLAIFIIATLTWLCIPVFGWLISGFVWMWGLYRTGVVADDMRVLANAKG